MLGKFLCQSLVSPTGLALASLAHLRAFYEKRYESEKRSFIAFASSLQYQGQTLMSRVRIHSSEKVCDQRGMVDSSSFLRRVKFDLVA